VVVMVGVAVMVGHGDDEDNCFSSLSPPLPCCYFLFRIFQDCRVPTDRLCGLVVRVPGYRSRGPGSILGATTFSQY
jgi:hypothetical protein